MNDDNLAKLDELLDVDEGLTAWEVEFIESLNQQRGRDWTERQLSTLERIYERVCR